MNRQTTCKGLVLAAPSSSCGKTILTIGLLQALRQFSLRPVAAKSGPDYIDLAFLRAASCAASNLDPWAMSAQRLRQLATKLSAKGDFLLVEGAMGLFDGIGKTGSTADLAAILGLPVILILDVRGQAQTAAKIAQGLCHQKIKIGGVILNRIASLRHEKRIRTAFAETDLNILGAIPENNALALPSRHLGLVQMREHSDFHQFAQRAGAIIAEHIDIAAFCTAAGKLDLPPGTPPQALAPLGQHIALACDDAFAFVYPHILQGWRKQGASVSFFSPLANEAPDKTADSIFLPGGYPELYAAKLSQNDNFLSGLRKAASRNALIYGECGGYMVLGEYLYDAQKNGYQMANLLPHSTQSGAKRPVLGYRYLSVIGTQLPWRGVLSGHEFHYSDATNSLRETKLFAMQDAEGNDLGTSGTQIGTVMGSYAHIIDHAPVPDFGQSGKIDQS